MNVAIVASASTVTDAGTWAAAGSVDVKLITAPPAGAGLSKLNVPVEDTPPGTEAGVTSTQLSAPPGAVTVKLAVRLTLL